MKIKESGIFLCILLFEFAAGSAVVSGTIVSRKPVLIDKQTPTLTSIQKKPIEVHTTDTTGTTVEDVHTDDNTEGLPSPTRATHENTDPNTESATTAPSPMADPTDYSTVWPTRWRPRRRLNFGAEADAGRPRVSPDRLLISFVIFGAFISGILL